MRDLDEFTVTDETLSQMAGTENKRLKELGDAAVRHMHAFAREVNLTPEEWLQGIACADSRLGDRKELYGSTKATPQA